MADRVNASPRYRTYWSTWGLLLGITLVMLLTGALALPKWLLLAFLLTAMLVKATLIGAQFMHLRFEQLSLILMVAIGILATGLALFAGIAFDAVRILRLSGH